jgi:hypothetical protein
MDAQRSTLPLIVWLAQQQPPLVAVLQAAGVVVLALELPQDVEEQPLLAKHLRHPRQRQVEADRAPVVVEADKPAAAVEAAELPEKP